MAAVGGLVDAVRGEAAGEEAREAVASEPVRDEPVRAVRKRDHDVAAPAGTVTLEQGREDLGHGAKPARREIGDLDGWQRRRGVVERPGPAEVVEVVSRALLVATAEAETGDRAVDGAFGHVLRADAEPRGDAGAE